MAQMNVSLPESLKTWAERRVAEGDYSSASDYIRDLMRRDREAAGRLSALRQAIDEGYASGFDAVDPATIIEEIIAERRATVG